MSSRFIGSSSLWERIKSSCFTSTAIPKASLSSRIEKMEIHVDRHSRWDDNVDTNKSSTNTNTTNMKGLLTTLAKKVSSIVLSVWITIKVRFAKTNVTIKDKIGDGKAPEVSVGADDDSGDTLFD